MTTKHTSSHHTKSHAKQVTSDGKAVRDRVRELTVAAFRDRELSMKDVPKLVGEVLEGAVQGLDASIPKTHNSVLREVFDGLGEGVHTIANAGSAVAAEVASRGHTIATKTASTAKHIHAARSEFLGAVKSFARKASKQVGEELHSLAARAEGTGPKLADSARKIKDATSGRMKELSSETAKAGVSAARRAAGALAMGAGGFFEGIADAVSPKSKVTTAKPTKSPAATVVKKKAIKKTPKK